MHKPIVESWIALTLLTAAQVPPAAAQSERAAQEEREQEQRAREQAQREREAERRSREQELQSARAELERAAAEVARLSQQFAAPYVRGMAKQWQSFGRRAMLGITPEDTELGVRVAGVSPNGPAAEAGIDIGDVIVEIDGAALADPAGSARGKQSPSELLLAQMGNVEPGESVALKVQRDGADRDVTVQTHARDGFAFEWGWDDEPPIRFDTPRWTGRFFGGNPWQEMQLVTLTPELGTYFGTDEGILVVRGPQSDELGLEDGDVILDIGGRVPATPEHAMRILGSFEQGETLKINVMRRQRREALELVLPAE
jgi:hypothetical protein